MCNFCFIIKILHYFAKIIKYYIKLQIKMLFKEKLTFLGIGYFIMRRRLKHKHIKKVFSD